MWSQVGARGAGWGGRERIVSKILNARSQIGHYVRPSQCPLEASRRMIFLVCIFFLILDDVGNTLVGSIGRCRGRNAYITGVPISKSRFPSRPYEKSPAPILANPPPRPHPASSSGRRAEGHRRRVEAANRRRWTQRCPQAPRRGAGAGGAGREVGVTGGESRRLGIAYRIENAQHNLTFLGTFREILNYAKHPYCRCNLTPSWLPPSAGSVRETFTFSLKTINVTKTLT